MSGYSCAKACTAGGSSMPASVGVMTSETWPRLRLRASLKPTLKASRSLKMRSAMTSASAAAWVGCNARVVRSNSRTPKPSSNWRINTLTADGVMNICAAAAPSLRRR